jgi:hypothetical protein
VGERVASYGEFIGTRPSYVTAIAVVILFMLTAFTPGISSEAKAEASTPDQSKVNTLWPETSAYVNRTVANRATDAYAQVDLAAGVWSISKGVPEGATTVSVNVLGCANSRNKVGYDWLTQGLTETYQYDIESVGSNLKGTCDVNAMGDDGGVWVNVADLYSLYGTTFSTHMLVYYGHWYNWVYISSNGFIVLSNTKGVMGVEIPTEWKTKTPPSTWPSTTSPNTVLAPFWRDLNPPGCGSTGGSVKYGIFSPKAGLQFVVFRWYKVPDKQANPMPQSFAIVFDVDDMHLSYAKKDWPLAPIDFIYGSYDGGAETRIGIEDNGGFRGIDFGTAANVPPSMKIRFNPTADSRFVITQYTMKIEKLKLVDNVWQWDTQSGLVIGGIGSLSGPATMNLQQDGPIDYTSNMDKWGMFSGVAGVLLTFASLAIPGVGEVTLIVNAINYGSAAKNIASLGVALYRSLDPVANQAIGTYWKDDANGNKNALYYANDKNSTLAGTSGFPFSAWDVAIAPQISWKIPESGSLSCPRKLVITTEITYQQYTYGQGWVGSPVTLSTKTDMTPDADGIKISPANLCPGGVQWFGRSIPDGHFQSVDPVANSYGSNGIGYQLASWTGTATENFDAIGWNVTNTMQHSVRNGGSILIEGWFRQWDTYTMGDSRQQTNLYVMYADKPSNTALEDYGNFEVVKKVPILTSADGMSFVFKKVRVDELQEGRHVKIGIGRTVYAGTAASVYCEWAGLRQYDAWSQGTTMWALGVKSASDGLGHTVPAATTTYSIYNTGGQSCLVQGDPDDPTLFELGYWKLDGVDKLPTSYGASGTGYYSVAADGDHIVEPCFISLRNKILYESIEAGSGTLSPSVGVHLYNKGSVTVTATPAVGYAFDYWSKDGVRQATQSPANKISITMSADHTLAAYFVASPGSWKTLTVSTSDSSKGTTSPGPWPYPYAVNTYSATFSGVPKYPYALSYWLVDGSSKFTTSTISVYMDKDHTLVAYWKTTGCVAQGTDVTMADGTTKDIEKIKVGDQVLGYDTSTNEYVVEKVLDTHKTNVCSVMSINDGALRVTPYDQKIWVCNETRTGWILDPVEIEIGWMIYDALSMKWVEVTELDVESGRIWVYDITTDGPQTYIADSFLVKDKPLP